MCLARFSDVDFTGFGGWEVELPKLRHLTQLVGAPSRQNGPTPSERSRRDRYLGCPGRVGVWGGALSDGGAAAGVEHGPAAGEDESGAGEGEGQVGGVEGGEGVRGEAIGCPGCGEDGGEDAQGLHDEQGALGALEVEAATAAFGAEEDGGGGGWGVVGGDGGGVGAEGLA
jgi:hypothetical protein